MPRKKGSKNRATIEREEKARLQAENAAFISEQERLAPGAAAVLGRVSGKKLGKDILDDFANLFAGLAAHYQPWPPSQGVNPNENEPKFKEYSILAIKAAGDVAQFQSPKLGAVLIGAAIVNKVEVSGGMPDDFRAPAELPPPSQDGKVTTLAPGTIITADDEPAAAVAGSAAA